MELTDSVLSGVAIMFGGLWGMAGMYWAMEFARGTPQAGSYLWTCVFIAVLASIVFWFDQRRLQDSG